MHIRFITAAGVTTCHNAVIADLANSTNSSPSKTATSIAPSVPPGVTLISTDTSGASVPADPKAIHGNVSKHERLDERIWGKKSTNAYWLGSMVILVACVAQWIHTPLLHNS